MKKISNYFALASIVAITACEKIDFEQWKSGEKAKFEQDSAKYNGGPIQIEIDSTVQDTVQIDLGG